MFGPLPNALVRTRRAAHRVAMSAHASKKALYAALAANAGIAVAKFCGAAYTGSSAMVSEGIHSLVDTGNQILLLYGIRDASRPADASHPFGYGLRLYFWGFVFAVAVFALGSGVAIIEGPRRGSIQRASIMPGSICSSC